ncbi:hypothetical protein [Mesorhizobium sp. ANAO-SY3R2]|uniref:hypothetical protein n=1 Tax=Mesorhizobium sp. ANAO-SY3R2 TaxID=3166644 RepID=UPI00366B0270
MHESEPETVGTLPRPSAVRGKVDQRQSWPVGFMTGQGRTSTDIVEHLNDGTDSATVRALWKKWGLPIDKTGGRRRGNVPVSLTIHQRKILAKRAKQVGVTPEEYLRRIASCAIEDDLYAAVTDGKFDHKAPATRMD